MIQLVLRSLFGALMVLACIPASGMTATRLELTFDGFDLTRFGGGVETLALRFVFPNEPIPDPDLGDIYPLNGIALFKATSGAITIGATTAIPRK